MIQVVVVDQNKAEFDKILTIVMAVIMEKVEKRRNKHQVQACRSPLGNARATRKGPPGILISHRMKIIR